MNAKPVTVVATLKARPGQEETLRQELLALIPATRAEAGCLNYDLHRATDNPALFLFHENWTSKADLDAHLAKPHLQNFLAKAADLLAEEPNITRWERIG
jgi:quinol monooxygenase YgiN